MKLHGSITINGELIEKGEEVSALGVYIFFLFHIGLFGWTSFVVAYSGKDVSALFVLGFYGFAIALYLYFYRCFFGFDEVKWMLINAFLGVYGIVCEINLILGYFGKDIYRYPVHYNFLPFIFYVLYTFLIRQAFIDLFSARNNQNRKKVAEVVYVALSVGIYTYLLFTQINA